MRRRKIEDPLVREKMPVKVVQVIDNRMRERIRMAGNQASYGNLDLSSLARDSYMQGFYDCVAACERRGYSVGDWLISKDESFDPREVLTI